MDFKNRLKLLVTAKDNTELQQLLTEQCKRDPVYWVETFCYTFDPRLKSALVPFELFDFQRWFLQELKGADSDIKIEKSRDMGLSWVLMTYFLWEWLFIENTDLLVGTVREKDTDTGGMDPSTLFGKFRYNLFKLPKWMVPEHVDNKLNMRNLDNGNILTGSAATLDFGRGPRKSKILLDEFAFWDNADEINSTVASTTNIRIINSTPNGESNAYFREMHDPNNMFVPFPGAEKLKAEKLEKV